MTRRQQDADRVRVERGDRLLGCVLRVLTHTAAAVVGMLAGILLCI